MSQKEPQVLRWGPGYFVTDRPYGGAPLVIYIEDFPHLGLHPGQKLKITGNDWEQEAIARFRSPIPRGTRTP